MLKALAKKIITSPPLSVEYASPCLPRLIASHLEKLDIEIQNWALTQSDLFSEDDWKEIQLKKLKKILVYAGSHVPYWKRLFEKLKFNPLNLKKVEDIDCLPITTRSDLKNIPLEELTAKGIHSRRFIHAATSGSTNEPLFFFQDKRDLFRRRINTFQELRYIGFSANRCIILGLESHKDLEGIGIHIFPPDLEINKKRLQEIYPVICSVNQPLLISTPTYLERLAFFFKRDNFRHTFGAIVYRGEHLTTDERTSLEKFFGCPIFSTYGTTECSLIGIQCSQRNFHLAPWMNYTEVINGMIVVTLFENEVMPFIRYAIGDEGMITSQKCPCGRRLKLIEPQGRRAGLLEFSDGSIYPMFNILNHFAQNFSDRIKKFQVEQTSDHLIFRYVPSTYATRDLEEKIKIYLHSINKKATVEIEATEYISPNKSGKTPVLIKNLKK